MLPIAGVGLARIEFIIANSIGIHPLALLHFDDITDESIKKEIQEKTIMYAQKDEFYVDQLAQGIAVIAAAFYPRPVVVRFSDFNTNEYKCLIGGAQFEPEEENPMLGFRGASRYYHAFFKEAFSLECLAMVRVCSQMGLDNIIPMVPFVRTVAEAEHVLQEISSYQLKTVEKNIPIYMMCEIPSNVILIDQFSDHFDGFSIGSNDLTQLVLGVDRDSALISSIFNENDEAVKKMICLAIEGAKKKGKKISICGQAPSDYPAFMQFLIDQGIDGVSLNPDAILNLFVV